MNPVWLDILLNALLVAFFICCVVSAVLQIVAAMRHSLGEGVSPAALWRPEGFFDAVGLRQMRVARRLLVTGVAAYLLFGLLRLAFSAG